ncbi:glutathione ABC transporter substrate-binding protein [Natranaerobius thermophilus]|uniref:Extracellular solute-binding protein family 5 n=1 Tax=Natranaerobius thermophilus (strain ATCC BAA-1301 / DSM 18059 / JW/NM-WN-LF) TaxID=457570 RepID=B2A0U0_NATTJ|nr:glutathione ABC transporter substrate-binding protein [Natranaerobius thermophilus]ACB85970.1 extracellular solute-binding protein family 5 [Natranaerobius thermophilus JW/NM-WN-LF]
MKKFNKKPFWLAIVLSGLLVFTLTGCGEPDVEDEAEAPEGEEEEEMEERLEEDHLVVAQGADAPTLDPIGENDQPSARITEQIFDTLVEQDENMEVQPGLAEDWEQIDDTTYEFYLREGVKFHNGEELTAEDVKYSYQRLLDEDEASPGAFILEMVDVDNIEIVDDYTVQIPLEEPFAPILYHLGHSVTAIVNEDAVEEHGDDFGQNPVGTGPFKFDDWDIGNRIDLVSFDDHWRGEAGVEQLSFRNIEEDTNRTIELETGGADIIYDVAPTDLERVEDHEELTLLREPNLSTEYIGFNIDKEPFDDERVRQAINYALDMEPIVEGVYYGLGEPARSPLAPAVVHNNQDVKSYEQDMERAEELLAEAGYEDGFEAEIWTNDQQQRQDIAEMVQGQLSQLGIDLNISIREWGTYLEETAQGEHDMFILGWVSVTGDADYGLYSLFHGDEHGAAGNRTFYDNDRVDELLDEGRRTFDEDERAEIYAEIQEIVTEEAPWIFTQVGEEAVGTRDFVENFTINPAGHHDLFEVTIAD